MNLRFSGLLVCLMALTSPLAHAISVGIECEATLWPQSKSLKLSLIGPDLMPFILRNYSSATIAAKAITDSAELPKAVEGISIPPGLLAHGQGWKTMIFSGAKDALIGQIAALKKQYGNVEFAIQYGDLIGSGLSLMDIAKASAVLKPTGASFANVLANKTGLTVSITPVHQHFSYVGYSTAKFAEIDDQLLAALHIKVLPGPLAKMNSLPPGTEPWIIRTAQHVLASPDAVLRLDALEEIEWKQSQFVNDQVQEKLQRCLNGSCESEAFPAQLASAEAVITHMLERFEIKIDTPNAAALMFDKMYQVFAPGQHRAAPLNMNDAANTLDTRFNFKSAKNRVMIAFKELEAKAAASVPPPPPVAPPPAPVKRSKTTASKPSVKPAVAPSSPVVEEKKPAQSIAIAPAAPAEVPKLVPPPPKVVSNPKAAQANKISPKPTPDQVVQDLQNGVMSDDMKKFEASLLSGTDIAQPGVLTAELSPETEDAIIAVLARYVKVEQTPAGFTHAFNLIFRLLRNRTLSQTAYEKWQVEIAKQARQLAPPVRPGSARSGLGAAWRMLQLMIRDPMVSRTITVQNVEGTAARLQQYLPLRGQQPAAKQIAR